MHVGFKEKRRTELFLGNNSGKHILCHYHIQVLLSYFAYHGAFRASLRLPKEKKYETRVFR